MGRGLGWIVAAGLLAAGAPLWAQDAGLPQSDAEWREWVPDPAALSLPQTAFIEDRADTRDYEKYFYFHRPATDFAAALSDLRDCDALARGLFRGDFAHRIGAVRLGAVLVDMLHGSQQARDYRRINMRRCMHYKGYSRFGLNKDLWQRFNFEEGNADIPEEQRQRMLALQALVASGDIPQAHEIGL